MEVVKSIKNVVEEISKINTYRHFIKRKNSEKIANCCQISIKSTSVRNNSQF